MRSHLLEGKVRHRRARPTVYALEHDVWYLALDLDEIDAVAGSLRLLSRNRPNILSLRDGDHLDPPAADLRTAIQAHLRASGIDPDGWRVTLVTNVRVFGYVFNPASFYLCRDRAGALQVVIVEVHNTHGERHLYTLQPERRGAAHVAEMDKDFYVSPFIGMDAHYRVQVRDEPSRLRIAIDETQQGEPFLATSVTLTRRRLTDRNLARMLVRTPFVTHKTIGMIHWHALRLWLRGLRFHHHGAGSR
jgi:uncharacterized protein